MEITKDNIKNAIDNPYVFPGGYTTIYICADGGTLCPQCAEEERELIEESVENHLYPQWDVVAQEILYENATGMTCDHCYKVHESAY